MRRSSAAELWNSVALSTVSVRTGRGWVLISRRARWFTCAPVRCRSLPTARKPDLRSTIVSTHGPAWPPPPPVSPRGEAGLAPAHRQPARPGLPRPEHRVAFPMPDARAVHRAGGPRRDGALPGEAPAAVVCPVAFAAVLPRTAEMQIELAARSLVGPEVPVDGLVTDLQEPAAMKPARDLFWAPVFAHERLDASPVRRLESGVPARARPASQRVPVRELRPIPPPIVRRDVPTDLPPD